MRPIEAIILIIQTILIAGQLYLSYRINRQDLSKNKGYFVIETTNYVVSRYKSEYNYRYRLRDRICFYATGADDVIVKGYSIEVNGAIKESSNAPRRTYFTRNERFGNIFFCFPLSENDFSKGRIDIKLVFQLNNTQGYSYIEEIVMKFIRLSDDDDWDLAAYNIDFH